MKREVLNTEQKDDPKNALGGVPFFSELVIREASFSTASSAFSRTLPRALPREAKGLGTQRSHSWRSLGILSERSNSVYSSLLYIWKKFSVIPSVEKKQLDMCMSSFSPSITEAFTMTSMLIPNHLIYTFICIFSMKVDGISKRNNVENYELFPGNDLQMDTNGGFSTPLVHMRLFSNGHLGIWVTTTLWSFATLWN